MDRTKFYGTATVDSKLELDFMNTSIDKFKFQYPFQFHRVTEVDAKRPDLISEQYYETVIYWWIILRVNGIRDPYEGLNPGDLLQIPSLLDLFNNYKQYRMR